MNVLYALSIATLAGLALIGKSTFAGPHALLPGPTTSHFPSGQAPKTTTAPTTTYLPSSARPAGGSAVLNPHGAQVMALYNLPAPTGLANTVDNTVCSAHGGLGAGLACKASVPAGGLALVWNYPAGKKITGFHVYDINLGGATLVGTQALGAGTTIFILDKPPAGSDFSQHCYGVTAYNGRVDSDYSNVFCGSGAQQLQTTSLKPDAWRSSGLHNVTRQQEFSYDPQAPRVGYNYATYKGSSAIHDQYTNDALRTGLMFDLSSLRGAHIVSATLRMEVDRTWSGLYVYPSSANGTDMPSDHETSCTAKYFLGRDRWVKNGDWIETGDEITETGVGDGPDIRLDLTRTVRAWLGGKENRGLVMVGEEENMTAFTEKGCVTQYFPDSFDLDVVYY